MTNKNTMKGFISSFEIQPISPQFAISNIETTEMIDDYRENNLPDSTPDQAASFKMMEASQLERKQMTYN